MDNSRRTQRVASMIRAELAKILLEEIADPALSVLQVNEVELSKDLKHARVFFSLGDTKLKAKDIQRGLSRAMPFFRRKLGDNLDLRYVPSLEFEEDTHNDSVDRVFTLLHEVQKETPKDLETT